MKYNLMPDDENSNNTELFTLGNVTKENINYLKRENRNNNNLGKMNKTQRKNQDERINNLKIKNDNLKLVIQKVKNLENSINSINASNSNFDDIEYKEIEKNNEKINIENEIQSDNIKLKAEIDNNEELDSKIKIDDEIGKLTQNDFNNDVQLIEDLVKIKGDELSECKEKINDIIQNAESVPNYKQEKEKNDEYKQKIDELKDKVLKLNTDAEIAEMVNNYIIKKKKEVIEETRKYIDLNIELKREIEAKNTMNDSRIQKKSREANSEEIAELKNNLDITNKKIKDLENKIKNECEKKQNFSKDIIKCNIKLSHKKEEEDELLKKIEKYKQELEEKKKQYDNLENESDELKDNIGKEKTDNELLKNRNKLLNEENDSLVSKYDFITNNYDYTTNLKKISMEDLKNLEQSNTLVNNTIGNFVEKVGTFKKNNIQNLLFDDNI